MNPPPTLVRLRPTRLDLGGLRSLRRLDILGCRGPTSDKRRRADDEAGAFHLNSEGSVSGSNIAVLALYSDLEARLEFGHQQLDVLRRIAPGRDGHAPRSLRQPGEQVGVCRWATAAGVGTQVEHIEAGACIRRRAGSRHDSGGGTLIEAGRDERDGLSPRQLRKRRERPPESIQAAFHSGGAPVGRFRADRGHRTFGFLGVAAGLGHVVADVAPVGCHAVLWALFEPEAAGDASDGVSKDGPLGGERKRGVRHEWQVDDCDAVVHAQSIEQRSRDLNGQPFSARGERLFVDGHDHCPAGLRHVCRVRLPRCPPDRRVGQGPGPAADSSDPQNGTRLATERHGQVRRSQRVGHPASLVEHDDVDGERRRLRGQRPTRQNERCQRGGARPRRSPEEDCREWRPFGVTDQCPGHRILRSRPRCLPGGSHGYQARSNVAVDSGLTGRCAHGERGWPRSDERCALDRSWLLAGDRTH